MTYATIIQIISLKISVDGTPEFLAMEKATLTAVSGDRLPPSTPPVYPHSENDVL
jgi:hypothetical protein